MSKKQSLTSLHFDILKTIGELQPCGVYVIARKLGITPSRVEKRIFQTLYSRGLIDTDLLTKSRRKPGTIHLTEEGEDLIGNG